MPSTTELRKAIAPLIDSDNPTDAPTAYYALYHDPNRSNLAVRFEASGIHAAGFAGRFQTGLDLFRPVVVLKCQQPEIAADLLQEVLVVGRPYILFSNANQLPLIGGSLEV